MKYKYTYRNTAGELWQLSMYYIYGSMAGLCNIIFTAACFCSGILQMGPGPWIREVPHCAGMLSFTIMASR